MREEILWTNLTVTEIAQRLADGGTAVSVTVVIQLFRRAGYVKRKAQKHTAAAKHSQSDQQFRQITRLREQYKHTGHPILSMDTKKKELLGNFYRDGKLYTFKTLRTLDRVCGATSFSPLCRRGM